MAFPWVKIVSVGFTAISETMAAAQDGKVTVEEAFKLASDICSALGAAFDGQGAAFVLKAVEMLLKAAADKKITAAELISIGEQVCADLGVELDKTGFSIPV